MGFWDNLSKAAALTHPKLSALPFSMGGRLLGNPGGMPGLEEFNRRYYNTTPRVDRYGDPYRRGGQIRVIGMPNIAIKKKRKCKRCKRK
jgi:hypothetical protein